MNLKGVDGRSHDPLKELSQHSFGLTEENLKRYGSE